MSAPVMMDALIEEALVVGDDPEGLDPSFWDHADHPAAARLHVALQTTGPLLCGGRVFMAGDGESYSNGIAVIEGVRRAEQVTVPAARTEREGLPRS